MHITRLSPPIVYFKVMKWAAIYLATAIVAGCATNDRSALYPSNLTIARIESGHALLQDIKVVGVADSATMNDNARVHVRNVACSASAADAICDYEASRCLEDETDTDGDGWCRRTARFIKIAWPSDPFQSVMIDKGWTVDRVR